MSYNQVKHYQDLEDYAAAYRIARADWAANPNLQWPRKTIGWLLVRMMKTDANAYSQKKFIGELQEFSTLGIPPTDKRLWGAVAWPIRDIVADSLKMQWFTPQFGDRLFAVLQTLPLDKPSESYSAMVKAFISLGGLWPCLAEFIEWWGFDSFIDYDYRRYPENGALESLVERVMTAYLVSLHRSGDGRQPSGAFYKALDDLAFRSREQADKIYKITRYGKN